MNRPILITGGRVIDPSRGADGRADVLLMDGKVEAVGAGIGRPEFSIASAPCTAKMRPRLDQLNMATKCAAAKASTM